eukprot:TRINITY_DN65897_c0_g1_i1.p2 TRINITY_DN65897_c0_g1~~TRINITY_DN65897_c0_g1_i1.p2  ORF type:complete len:228 (+),score=89.06 TRINITY_DN65897_c0_g1_i1:135-818(+)
MPAAYGGIICKVILLALAIVMLIVVAAAPNSLYTTPNLSQKAVDDAKDALDNLFEDGKNGWGLFKATSHRFRYSSNMDVLDALWCDNLKSLWRGMQAACLIAIFGMAISIIVTLTYLCSQDDKCMRTAAGCCGDILGILGLLTFIVLIVMGFKTSICQGDWDEMHKENILDTNPGALEAHFDLSYAIYLVSIATLFAFISVCIGLVAKRKPADSTSHTNYERQMESK